LALCAAIPARAAVPILILHAITSWPTIVDAYTPKSLQLNRFPWRAALRIESEQDYLARVSLDYRYVKLVEQNTPEDARILDLIGAHRALTTREFVGSWSTTLGIRSLEALEFARAQGTPAFQAIEATFEPSTISGVRIVESANTPEVWNLHSVELRNRGARIDNRQGWTVSSTVNRWELPLAFDANLVTRWSSWQAAERGMFVQVDMDRPIEADSVRILTPLATRTIRVEVQICRSGKWQRVAARSTEGPLLNLRPAVTATLKKAGITHILTPAAYQGIGFLGEKLVNEADDWNMDVVGNLYAVYLLKLR
jgi:hypothetical protein